MNEPETKPPVTAERPPERLPELARLPLTIAPQRDLWPAIETRIDRNIRLRRWRPVWSAAAGFAAAALIGLGAVADRHHILWQSPPAADSEPLRAPASIAAATRPTAANGLMPVVAHNLHPETRALVRANLKIVSSAESQLKHAMRQDPDEPYLKNLLATAREQKQALRVALAENDR